MVNFSLHKTKIPNSILAERNIVDLLFNRHLNIDLKDNQGITAAMIAAKNGILQCKMNPQKMTNLIHRKLITGKQHIVDTLITRGADFSIKDDNGKKAIDYAIENGKISY